MINSGRQVRIGEAAKMLGVTVQTLRNWEKSGKLRAQRSSGGQRYYTLQDLQPFTLDDLRVLGWAWATSAQPPELPEEYYCERQDRFMSRVEKMSVILGHAGIPEDLVSLITLMTGEMGDNSFAHNGGNWPDVQGVFYAYDVGKRIIVLADRGRGVRATLRHVRPELATDVEALRVAFTEIVSGRNPEKRGNGLKVVRSVAETKPIGLLYRSGLGVVHIPQEPGSMKIEMADENVRGTYAIITF